MTRYRIHMLFGFALAATLLASLWTATAIGDSEKPTKKPSYVSGRLGGAKAFAVFMDDLVERTHAAPLLKSYPGSEVRKRRQIITATNANISKGGEPVKQAKVVQPSDIKWEPHPLVAGIESAYLVSKRDENIDLTCMLVHVPPGTRVDKHTHECDEIIYVIEGQATMHIDGIGEVPMVAGTFLRIPKGVEHYPYDIKKDIRVYDVFYPHLR